ncbi:MAG: RIP metalloprotease RseP, partial [Methylobacterium sp.]|nr:RIP metalloprotease RseP [Methylobacterium sp.]
WMLFMSGLPGLRPILGEVEPGTPAAQASMKAGELIVRIGNTPVVTWQDVRWSLLKESLKSGSVEVEASSGSSETHLHQLDMSRIDPEDAGTDLLKQLGLSPYRPALPARIGEIQSGSAAERAGLQPGDEVVAVNGIAVALWEDFAGMMRQHPGKPVSLKLLRDGQEKTLSVTPDAVGEGPARTGRIGAGYRMSPEQLARLTVEVRHAPLPAFWQACVKTWETAVFSLKMLGNMVTGAVSWKGVSGPITIASFAGQSASLGWKAFAGFLALVSISLGVLNLLPVPVLDGGHLMYYTIEILKGSPVSDHAMEIGQKIGFLLLGLLMTAAFYNDINRMITG